MSSGFSYETHPKEEMQAWLADHGGRSARDYMDSTITSPAVTAGPAAPIFEAGEKRRRTETSTASDGADVDGAAVVAAVAASVAATGGAPAVVEVNAMDVDPRADEAPLPEPSPVAASFFGGGRPECA